MSSLTRSWWYFGILSTISDSNSEGFFFLCTFPVTLFFYCIIMCFTSMLPPLFLLLLLMSLCLGDHGNPAITGSQMGLPIRTHHGKLKDPSPNLTSLLKPALFLCHSQFSVSLWTTLSPCVLYQDLTPLLLPIFPVPFSVIIVADTVRKEDIHIQYIHIQDIGRKSRDKEEW